MKVMRVEAMKFTAGSWDKVAPVLKKIEDKGKAAGFPEVKLFASVAGGESMHTLYAISQWPSLAELEAVEGKMTGDTSLMEAIEDLAGIVDSSEVMLLRELSAKDLGL